MVERITLLFLSALLVRVTLFLVDLALNPAARLKLSLFRPYRGESWPIGVQEDDDMRFRWRAASTRLAGALAIPAPRAGRPARRTAPPDASMAAASDTIEDLPADAVPTQRPSSITVHGARH